MTRKNGHSPDELIAAIYEAALDPASWKVVLDGMLPVLEASSAVLYTPAASIENGLWAWTNIPEETVVARSSYYADKDVWTNSAVRQGLVDQGSIYTSERLVDPKEYERSEIYNDVYRQAEIYSVLGKVLFGHHFEPKTTVVSFFRPAGWPGFQRRDVHQLGQYAPHIQRSVELYWRLRQSEADRRAALAALDRLSAGVVLVDAQGLAVHLNRAAQALLHQRDGLTLANGHLAGATADATARLARVLGEAAGTFAQGTGSAGGALALPRRSGKASYLVTVSPLAPENPFADGPRRVAAVVFIDDPEAQVRTPPEVLHTLFGLTAAEAQVALAWANGERAQDISDSHGTSLATVRSQIRSVHEKLRVLRQAQVSKRIIKATALMQAEGG